MDLGPAVVRRRVDFFALVLKGHQMWGERSLPSPGVGRLTELETVARGRNGVCVLLLGKNISICWLREACRMLVS